MNTLEKIIYVAGRLFSATAAFSAGDITKQDLMELGLSGGPDSSVKRKLLLKKLDFPEHMSANAMLQALNVLYSLEELKQFVAEL